jgi:hypothetical protein
MAVSPVRRTTSGAAALRAVDRARRRVATDAARARGEPAAGDEAGRLARAGDDEAPHATEQVAPAQVMLPHALAAVQSTTQLLAALQSTSRSDDDGAETEQGMPAGQLAHPPRSEQRMTQVPALHVPTPAQRAVQRAAAVGLPPSDPSDPAFAVALSDASGSVSVFASFPILGRVDRSTATVFAFERTPSRSSGKSDRDRVPGLG